jgi:hypothetical protein
VERPRPGGRGAGGANHSCDSNLWMLDAHTMGARHDIMAGEDLTLDYALVTLPTGVAHARPLWRQPVSWRVAKHRRA